MNLHGRPPSNSLVDKIHPSTTSDVSSHHWTNRETETTQIMCEKPGILRRSATDDGGTSNVDLSEEFCLSVVDEASRSIVDAL